MRRGFSMIELIFVIVIIGILAGIAIPKFAATRDDAVIAKGRSDVAAIRAALATERQKRILKGDFTNTTYDLNTLLDYGLDKRWSNSGNTYKYKMPDGSTVDFTITTSGKFNCVDPTSQGCADLTK
jgi:general secretion pathway protein G